MRPYEIGVSVPIDPALPSHELRDVDDDCGDDGRWCSQCGYIFAVCTCDDEEDWWERVRKEDPRP